jgi:murein DD-endopeptidase MepM/ murein hydrolase activator NlpD
MALLHHEVRAVRARQVAGVVLAVVVVAMGIAVMMRDTLSRHFMSRAVSEAKSALPSQPPASPPAFVGPPLLVPSRAGRPDADAPTSLPAAELPPGAASSAIARVGRAHGFRDALVRAGCSHDESDRLVAALGTLIDFRRVQPNHELITVRDGTGHLMRFEYRASLTERVRAERTDTGSLAAAKVAVKREYRRIATGGYVNDSLGKALEALGLRNSLVGAFVEAFEGRIDFRKDMRSGDSFKLILDEEYIEDQPRGYGKLHALQYKGSQRGNVLAFWFESQPKLGDFYDEDGRGMHGGWLRTPLRYSHISSSFNLKRRHPILRRIVPHEGIDYAAAAGTPVWAAADGVVALAGPRGPNGNLIALRHPGGYETFYAHLSRVAPGIRPGTRVQQRQTIGAVGSTGRSTGPHLHFALKRAGRFVDPATQLNGPGKALAESSMARFRQQSAALKRELAAITLASAPAPSGEAAPAEEDFHEENLDL